MDCIIVAKSGLFVTVIYIADNVFRSAINRHLFCKDKVHIIFLMIECYKSTHFPETLVVRRLQKYIGVIETEGGGAGSFAGCGFERFWDGGRY